jgi:hypothetical protein
MKRILVVAVAMLTTVAVASSADAAKKKPLKVTANGWYVFDYGPDHKVGKTPKNGTYTRCVSDPNTPPVQELGGRYIISNRTAPVGMKQILNGPSGIHFSDPTPQKRKPGAYAHRFAASSIGRGSLPPGKYTFKVKVGKKTLMSEFIKLVDDNSC